MIFTWGQNHYGQLGNGTLDEQFHARATRRPDRRCGGCRRVGSSVALKSDGSMWNSGYNNAGQLGDDTTTNRYPVLMQRSERGVAVGGHGYRSPQGRRHGMDLG